MTTKAKLDAAFEAATPLVDKMIADAEAGIASPLMRRQADQAVHEHRAQIDAGVRAILVTGLDAAEKVTD
jgi:hypothetical protein